MAAGSSPKPRKPTPERARCEGGPDLGRTPRIAPVITVVLARPEIPANVGFIARNMACHGLTDLRITGRPGIAANPEAVRTASGEDAILAAARDFPDLESALSDCSAALAFSRRVRSPGQRILELSEAVAAFGSLTRTDGPATPATPAMPATRGGPLALVFGRESQGLSREETFACTQVVRIPLPGPMQSLNLSHAVAIALYAFFGGNPAWQDPGGEKRESGMRGAATSPSGPVAAADPASSGPGSEVLSLAESEQIVTGVINRLQERGLLNPVKAGAHEDYLRILWQRLQPTRREFEFLVGLLKKLAT
jgi:tRNA (cytidine32/uridine32-2'-O)-methyltransferase